MTPRRTCCDSVEEATVPHAPGCPAEAARKSLDEDHSPTRRHASRAHRSIPHSYGGESRNFID